MLKYFKYLRYVVRHKTFVMIECFRCGLFWRGLKHDLSKFLPCEFIPYANFFYGDKGEAKRRRDATGYYKPEDTGDSAFDMAWFHHQKWNDHHWQWWIQPTDGGGMKVLEMSPDARLEMVCDWKGAGRAQGVKSTNGQPEVLNWYTANRNKLVLGPATRIAVEFLVGFTEG